MNFCEHVAGLIRTNLVSCMQKQDSMFTIVHPIRGKTIIPGR